ncbi:MAG: DUF308 domain-containing protein [Lachnospiraceae bacterium]|nr:DUF308 domain-containing protein [Lachnospiraceae bacterium]
MGVINIILGVLLVLGGLSCLFTPFMTFLSLGYWIIILFFVYGIAAIVRSIATKSYGITLVFGIFSLFAGIVGLIHPGDVTLATDMFLLFLAGVWFIAQGIFLILLAFGAKRITGHFGWAGLVIGILAILLGMYSIAHPMIAALAIGMLISLYFIESGISLIMFGSVQNAVEDEIARRF